MPMNNICKFCPREVEDGHSLCRVCRSIRRGGNDDDPPGPGVAPNVTSGPKMSLAPTAEPNHRAGPSVGTA